MATSTNAALPHANAAGIASGETPSMNRAAQTWSGMRPAEGHGADHRQQRKACGEPHGGVIWDRAAHPERAYRRGTERDRGEPEQPGAEDRLRAATGGREACWSIGAVEPAGQAGTRTPATPPAARAATEVADPVATRRRPPPAPRARPPRPLAARRRPPRGGPGREARGPGDGHLPDQRCPHEADATQDQRLLGWHRRSRARRGCR